MLITTTFTIYEILEKAAKCKTYSEKVAMLKRHKTSYMDKFFEIVFDPKYTFSYPIPRHNAVDTYTDCASSSLKANLDMIIAVSDVGKYRDLPDEKKSKLLLNVLDAISKDEADLLVKVLKGKFAFKGLDIRAIKNVYGDYDETNKNSLPE